MLGDRITSWLTLRQPVTYWSFWRDLVRLAPVLIGLFVGFATLSLHGRRDSQQFRAAYRQHQRFDDDTDD
ncbi:hypothetical protein Halar_2404 [halophilic archaeon DL31]|nr:hypothetical protein Halar_2404 [halophilic archaeon DL31]